MKTLILIVALVTSISTFIIQESAEQSLQGLSWPFSICGKVTLAKTPVRNINDDIDVVNNFDIHIGTAFEDSSFTSVAINVKLNGVFLHS